MRYTIREKRLAKGLTQEQMAERTGISVAMYSMLEGGKRRMNEDHLQRIATVLGEQPSGLYAANNATLVDAIASVARDLPPEFQLRLLEEARILRLAHAGREQPPEAPRGPAPAKPRR